MRIALCVGLAALGKWIITLRRRGRSRASMGSVRAVAAFLLLASGVYAQFRSTVPLVIAPTTVADSHGRYVDGLAPEDLILYEPIGG